MTAVRGTIARAWIARCERCGGSDTVPTTRIAKESEAKRHFVTLGWLHTRFFGWVCPICAEQGDG